MVHGFNQAEISKCSLSWIFLIFICVLEQVSNVTFSEKIGLSLSEISNGCNVVEGSLSSGHENRASLCQRLFLLANVWAGP